MYHCANYRVFVCIHVQKLNSPTFSVTNEAFLPLLTQLDDSIEYLNKHVRFLMLSLLLELELRKTFTKI